MSESSLTLEAIMCDLGLSLEGDLMALSDRQRGPELLYPFPLYPSFAPTLPSPSPSLHLPEYYCSAAFDPPASHQSMQAAERREGWLLFQRFRCCLCHVSQGSDALFIHALMYVFIRLLFFPNTQSKYCQVT